jgi:hypothetical protein
MPGEAMAPEQEVTAWDHTVFWVPPHVSPKGIEAEFPKLAQAK